MLEVCRGDDHRVNILQGQKVVHDTGTIVVRGHTLERPFPWRARDSLSTDRRPRSFTTLWVPFRSAAMARQFTAPVSDADVTKGDTVIRAYDSSIGQCSGTADNFAAPAKRKLLLRGVYLPGLAFQLPESLEVRAGSSS